MNEFSIDWVLRNEIAIGKAPTNIQHVNKIKTYGINAVLSLCDGKEVSSEINMEDYFLYKNIILPDHKYKELLTIKKLNQALDVLYEIYNMGPVYIHCVASVERSPLVCMAWLIKNKKLSPYQALDYLMEVHKGTNPLPYQFKLLFNI